MDFGDNIINRTISNTSDTIIKNINNYLDVKMNINFLLGMISGYSLPFLVTAGTGYISLGDHALVSIDKIINDISNFDDLTLVIKLTELSEKGILAHGLFASCVSTLFFDDQFLSGTLIGLGTAIVDPLYVEGSTLIAIGAAYEYYLVTQ